VTDPERIAVGFARVLRAAGLTVPVDSSATFAASALSATGSTCGAGVGAGASPGRAGCAAVAVGWQDAVPHR